ncbi:hypothetical protein NOF04DRAFT_13803 [Fusarium oxysporum II5]|uniref:Uncharacterized protein n=2 Tax=Fusarium oxysporum species complex TaxID=171631 RepID=X0K929_FUSO5|nr:uncharacterized protein FOIG_13642 [Fusarium odoratissimum NRRL 54006]EXL93509.1 hypothetical protein FOIG_13642 [Fusarium odoratissimum NRRL 54006]KAK2136028.1 hypothetical protein NOF04DRAFT_13803 [Fusarium oxysporum II5]TXC03265.1 hypothetical protein FocTR4_00000141 [Fusarium oxysporum f. sp. cubense]
MSVVPSTGLLRKLYRDAAQDIEYQSSTFWQVWLQRAFHEDEYMISCEMPPDESRRRVDAVVKRYDDRHDTLSAVLWIEFKRPSGSVRQVEFQALDAAKRCIRTSNLESVYVMTTVGVSFRCWTVYGSDLLSLVPFNGGPADATRSQYIDADSYEAETLTRFVETVKAYPPLRRAPIVPSQPLPQSGYQQTGYSQTGYGGYPDTQQGYQAATGQGDYTSGTHGEADASGASYYAQNPASSVGEHGQTSSVSDQFIKVHVSRVAHFGRSTEYFFSDINGSQKRTTKDDWREVTYKGKLAWISSRRGVTYYTRDRIG